MSDTRIKTIAFYNTTLTTEDELEYEGEVTLWGKKSTILVEFSTDEYDETFKKNNFQLIEEKLRWVESHRQIILDTFVEEEGMFSGLNKMIQTGLIKNEEVQLKDLKFTETLKVETFLEALYIMCIDFWVEDDEVTFGFDLEAMPDYLFGHSARIEIEEDYTIEMGGIKG